MKRGNAVRGNTVLGNTVPGNTVPGNTVPGNTVPGNAVLGNAVLRKKAMCCKALCWKAIGVALLAIAAGCSFEALPDPVENECVSSAECGATTCDVARAMCINETADGYDVVLEVTPNAERSDAPPPWRSGVIRIDAPLAWPIRFAPHVEVRGRVRWSDAVSMSERRIPAEVIFTRPGLEGRPLQRLRVETFSEPRVDEETGEEFDFSVRLPPSTAFDVEVRPSSSLAEDGETPWLQILPPLYVLGQFETPEPEPGAEGPALWTALFPYPADLAEPCNRDRVDGCTLAGSVVGMEDGEPIPQRGLQVRAINGQGQVVSSAAFTDASGEFSLRIAPGVESYVLRVGAGPERPVFPTIVIDPAFLAGDFRIRVPRTRTIQYEGIVETASERSVAGATITFRSEDILDDDDGIRGSFEITVTSADDGTFSTELLAGEYEVVVTPLPSSANGTEYAVTSERLTIDPPEGVSELRGQLFTVPRVTTLGATVRTFDGRELAGATIEASALARLTADSRASQYNRTRTATTEATGLASVPLDVGVYDVTVKGGAGSRFAWFIETDVSVTAPGDTRVERFELQPPVPIFGDMRTADGRPLVDAEVRAFGRTESGRYVEIARGRSDADGAYRLLLPPSI